MNKTTIAVVLLALTAIGAGATHLGVDKPASGITRTGGGRWRAARSTASIDAELEALRTLGYLDGQSAAPPETGVTRHDRERAWPGYNLYVSGHGPEAHLVDMDGEVVHRWRLPFDEIWPGEAAQRKNWRRFWRRVALLPNGDLLAIVEGTGIFRIDRRSALRWRVANGAHHDLDIADDGTIWVLSRRPSHDPEWHPRRPILKEYLEQLGPEGRTLRRLSLLDMIRASRFRDLLPADPRRWHGDILHSNTLTVIRDETAVAGGTFLPGRILTSFRVPDAIAVIDLESESVVWRHRGPFRKQHDPQLLPNGRMLVFDNLGAGQNKSRVLEFDATTMKRTWSYEGTAGEPFFSDCCGTIQRLPNGNTLVAETGYGRAFEVTKAGEIVWEFLNPHRAGEHNELIASLFDIQRIDAARVDPWLRNPRERRPD